MKSPKGAARTGGAPTSSQDSLPVKLTLPANMRAGEDLHFRFDLAVNDLEPYLGAWAHIMILSEDREVFIHAHPLDDAATTADNSPWRHSHAVPGPSPSVIHLTTGFRKPGRYKLWAQLQREGEVFTIPFTLRVLPAVSMVRPKTVIPADAIRVDVSTSGFSPARIRVAPGTPARLAFVRGDAQSCASSVVFRELGIRKDLPVGEMVLIEIPVSTSGQEFHFSCGMNMHRGSLLVGR